MELLQQVLELFINIFARANPSFDWVNPSLHLNPPLFVFPWVNDEIRVAAVLWSRVLDGWPKLTNTIASRAYATTHVLPGFPLLRKLKPGVPPFGILEGLKTTHETVVSQRVH